jgi:OmpA-OmpF porin, OOP family
LGGGVSQFEVEVKRVSGPYLKAVDPTFQTHADFGLGIAFRLADRFNLGFETKGQAIFGNKADLLDGVARQDNDILVYSSVRLNFNLGNKEKLAEPLYWVNPMEVIMQDITELKSRPPVDLTDTDGDGVIDVLDSDNSTPAGVAVDTRGVPLDSDGDGIPNYRDDEPYIVAGKKVVIQKPGDKPFTNEDDVERILDNRLKEYAESGSLPGSGGITNWFLPMIHFGIDSHKIRYADYGSLSSIAKVMKANPTLRVVVLGFTDKTASDTYNLDLSFKRAKAAIEHLVNVHGIARSRLILNYNGEDDPLVPSTGSSMMNRRVEFRVATGEDVDMEQPIPVSKRDKKSGY